MEFCLYLAKNKTEVATQMVIHNIPHIFQRTKPIHTDCVSDPSTLNWGAVELHDVKSSGISALPLYGRWGKMIMASFRGADISPQEARASLWDQTFVNHQTAKRVGRWVSTGFQTNFHFSCTPNMLGPSSNYSGSQPSVLGRSFLWGSAFLCCKH